MLFLVPSVGRIVQPLIRLQSVVPFMVLRRKRHMQNNKKGGMKNYEQITKILGAWRLAQGLTFYRLEQLTGIRRDILKDMETKGRMVYADKIVDYLVVARQSGYDALEKLLDDIREEEIMAENKIAVDPTELDDGEMERWTSLPMEDEDDEDFKFAMYHYEEGDTLDEAEQKAMIRHGLCPCCGNRLTRVKMRKRNQTYIGHATLNKECGYFSFGDFKNPKLVEKFKGGVTRIKGAKKI